MLKKVLILAMALFLLGGLLVACTQGAQTNEDTGDDVTQIENGVEREEEEDEEQETIYQLYFMKTTETEFLLVSEPRTFEGEVNEAILVNALLEGPENEEYQKLIPEGIDLNDSYVEAGIAFLDFSDDIIKAGNFGAETEMHLINSLAKTVTQLSDVNSIQILANGLPAHGSHIDISEPITP